MRDGACLSKSCKPSVAAATSGVDAANNAGPLVWRSANRQTRQRRKQHDHGNSSTYSSSVAAVVVCARAAWQRASAVPASRWQESGRHGWHLRQSRLHSEELYGYAAHFSESFAEARGFGWTVGDTRFDWQTLKANPPGEILRLNGIYEGLLSKVHVVRGQATLLDAHYRCGRRPAVSGRTHSGRYRWLAAGAANHRT